MSKPTALVISVDIFLFNALLFLFHYLQWDSGTMHWWFMANVFYVISVLLLPPFAQGRFVRVEQIFSRTFQTVTLLFFLIAFYIYLDKRYELRNDLHEIVYEYAVSLVVLFYGRYFVKQLLKYLRGKGRNSKMVIFLGAGVNLEYLYDVMCSELSTGYNVYGYFDKQRSKHLSDKLPILGGLSDVLMWLERNGQRVEQIYCNLPPEDSDLISKVMTYCDKHFIRFFSVPNVRNYVHRSLVVKMIDDMPVLTLRREPLADSFNRAVKRTFDILVSGIFLITCFWWIYLIVALITKLTMPGPVFFCQKRNGYHGREFTMIKFRSMKVNKDADTLQATKNDPRKTVWGNIMRKTNIDELPQFINVFLGSMSVVGPRPHMVKHTEEYSALIEKYMVRHWVKPGITGWAQVRGARGETEELWQMEDRVQKDIWYLEHWSIWLDLRIIYLTIRNILLGDKQAY